MDENYRKLAAEFTLVQLAAGYIADNFAKKQTVNAKRNDIKQFLGFLAARGIELLEDLGRTSPKELGDLCREFMKKRSEKADGVRTLARKLSTVRNFLDHLCKTQAWILPVVPSLRYEELSATEVRSSATTITLEEWLKLREQLKQARNPQVHALACLAVMGGGRKFSECARMIWKDVRFNNDVIVIRKPNGSEHYLEMIPELKTILREHRGSKGPDEPLFTIPARTMNRTLKVHARKAGLDDSISFMTFRASFIMWASARGDSLDEAANATLHENAQLLRQYYSYDKPSTISVSSIVKTKKSLEIDVG